MATVRRVARAESRPQKEDFFADLDQARVTSGWSCLTVVLILGILYGLGFLVLTNVF